MFINNYLRLVISLLLLQGGGAFASSSPWTAAGAVEQALSNNPDSAIALNRIQQARANASMLKATDYPLVNLASEYGQTNNPMYSFGNILNQGAFSQDIDFNDPGRTDNLRLLAEMRYRLYNGGRDQALQEGAGAAIRHAEWELQGVRTELGFEVVKTFHAISQAENMVGVRTQAAEALTAAVAVAKARYEAGDMLQQDVLNLELEEAIAVENLIRANHDLALVKQSFLNLLGLPDQPVAIDSTGGPKQNLAESADIRQRFELQLLQAAEEMAQADLKKAKGGRLPTIDAVASYQGDYGFELEEGGDSWIAGIRLNYPLYDGNSTGQEIEKAQLKLQEIAKLQEKTLLRLELDLKKARLEYDQAKKRVEVTAKMVRVAQEVAGLSRERFKAGLILASELIDIEVRLADAQARHLAASAGYRVAIANQLRASGQEQFSLP